MAIRPKTSRRLIILTVLCIFAGALAYAGIRIAEHHNRLALEKMRQDGLADYAAKDWKGAADKLGNYVSDEETRSDTGPEYNEALFALAQSTDNLAHLSGGINTGDVNTAIDLWQKYLSRVPGSVKIQHNLLKLEEQVGRLDEALELSRELLAQNPQDQDAMEMMALCNYQSGKADAAQDMAISYNKLNPTDLNGWVLTFRIERQLNMPLKRMLVLPQQEEAISSDPRIKLAEVLAFRFGFNPEVDSSNMDQLIANEKNLLRQVTSPQVDPPDVPFVTLAVQLLDNFRLYPESEQLLQRAAAKLNDPVIRQEYVQRLWENGENASVVGQLQDITTASADASSSLLAYKAMALHALGKNADADALVETLGGRTDNDMAVAWSLALHANFHPDAGDAGQRFTDYQAAINRDPTNAVVHMMLAQAYYEAQENDLALEEAKIAEASLPSWEQPHLLIAEALAKTNLQPVGDAQAEAQLAVDATGGGQDSAGDTALVSLYFWQYQAAIYHHDPVAMQGLATSLEGFRKTHTDDAVIERLYVLSLAATGQSEKARESIHQTLANPPVERAEGTSKRGGESLLIDLARASSECSLGLEDQILSVAQQKFGLTPRIAYSVAEHALESRQKTVAQAIAFLQDAATKGNGDAWTWALSIAQFREEHHDPGAKDAWVALGNAYPANLAVQQAILNFNLAYSLWRVAGTDPAFLNTTIARVHALTGDQAIGWRLATARVLLSSEKPDDANQASALLSDVLKHQFAAMLDFEPHILQSQAMEILGNLNGAVAEMNHAAQMAPTDPRVLFKVVYLYNKAKRYSDARDAFDRLASLTVTIPEPIAEAVAAMMFNQGEYQRAADMLSHYSDLPDAPDSVVGLLAMCDQELGNPTDAGRYFLKLKDATDLSPDVIKAASAFFAAYGQVDTARLFLAKLDNASLPAGQQQTAKADFEERFGDAAKADAIYQAAIAADKSNPQPVADYIGYLIRRHRLPDASKTADAAVTSWPSNGQFPALQSLAAALTSSSYADRLAPLADEMSRDAANPVMGATIALMNSTQSLSDADAVQQMTSALSDPKNAGYYPLYELIVGRMLASHDSTIHSAAEDLARQAMEKFTMAPAYKLAANAYAANGDWTKALRAAQQWRQRDSFDAKEPDFYIAKFDVNLGDPTAAAAVLEPYVADAGGNPQDRVNLNILRLYAQTQLLTGHVDDADKLLRPLADPTATDSATWRAIWLNLAIDSFTDGDSAAGWIERVRPLIDSSSNVEKMALASTWYSVAKQYSYDKGDANCRDILKPMADAGQLDQATLLVLAEVESDLSAADAPAMYQKVIDAGNGKASGDTAIAQNNLANILLEKGDADSLATAEPLALGATQCTDPAVANTVPYFFDTLGHIYLKEGKYGDAVKQFEQANQLLPNDPLILIGLADAQQRDGKTDRARSTLLDLSQHMDPAVRLSAAYQSELDAVKAAVKPQTRPSASSADAAVDAGRP